MNRPVEILLVEDEPSDIDIARLGFRRAKINNRVHVTQTAEQALLFLKKRAPFDEAPTPDLIFLDLGLPGTSGTTVLEYVHTRPDLKRVPVIVLTGSDAPDVVDDAYRLHASCFLTKPVDLSLLLEVVSSLDGFFVQIGRVASSEAVE